MKVSIVIICWNDRDDILKCLESIYREKKGISFEVIVTDNGSTDGSVEAVRGQFPAVKVVENVRNLGFGGGNNSGFREASGDYVLILNPDTILHTSALERLTSYADRHPEAGAFGCRVLNADGSYQHSAYPCPSVRSSLVAALYLRSLGRYSHLFEADTYRGWNGHSERVIGFQAGCCLLIRRELLLKLRGFDERLFHQYEDADLCLRVWKAGYSVSFCPDAEITHIGGLNRGRYPVAVILETHRSRYRFFYKHYGLSAVSKIRWIALISAALRLAGYQIVALCRRRDDLKKRLQVYRILIKWHWRMDPVRFIQSGEEPNLGYSPLAPAPDMLALDQV
ncbi:glycosyltransferase family 2 protein [Verrucomicrobiota bacterium sgz303538]